MISRYTPYSSDVADKKLVKYLALKKKFEAKILELREKVKIDGETIGTIVVQVLHEDSSSERRREGNSLTEEKIVYEDNKDFSSILNEYKRIILLMTIKSGVHDTDIQADDVRIIKKQGEWRFMVLDIAQDIDDILQGNSLLGRAEKSLRAILEKAVRVGRGEDSYWS